MAEEGRDSEPNQAQNRRTSKPEGPCMFRGSGDATLTVYGFEAWKDFLKRGDRPLTDEELERIVAAASCENFSVGGRISVEWPDVRVDFAMDHFIGRKKRKQPFIVSATENFSTIMHPFAVNKEWCRGLGDKDKIKLEGYEWVFEQDEDFTEYKGHIRHGKEIFITFQFTPDWRYHYTH